MDSRPKKKFALMPEEREKVCDHPLGFPYRGKIPCTGPKVCPLCGTRDEDAVCCRFHAAGGTPDLSCGGDLPNNEGRHLRDCAMQGGGDCTCGRGTPES